MVSYYFFGEFIYLMINNVLCCLVMDLYVFSKQLSLLFHLLSMLILPFRDLSLYNASPFTFSLYNTFQKRRRHQFPRCCFFS